MNVKKVTLLTFLAFGIWFLFFSIKAQEINSNTSLKNEFVVIIPSYNNKDWYIKNLDSVFEQDYPFFEVIYIDDCSSDGTADLVAQYIKEKGQEYRTTLIRNKKRLYHLANRYRPNYLVPNHKIIVELDGDDWYADPGVLSFLNEIYADPEVWLTYGQFQRYPSNRIGYCKPFPEQVLQENGFRDYRWLATHLRTYRSWLFKHINLKDFFYEGSFFHIGADLSYMYPMLEMAGGKHIKFAEKVLCIRNGANVIGTEKVWSNEERKSIHMHVRNKDRYNLVEGPRCFNTKDPSVDMIVFSQNPHQLHEFLESVQCYMTGINNIYIVCQPNSDSSNDVYSYTDVIKGHSNIFLVQSCDKTGSAFKQSVLGLIDSKPSTHIIVAQDNIVVRDHIDVSRCAHMLRNTFGYGFYLHLGFDAESIVESDSEPAFAYAYIDDDVYAWQFSYGEGHWQQSDNLGMVLYKKGDVLKRIEQIDFIDMQLATKWASHVVPQDKIGLFFQNLKVRRARSDESNSSHKNQIL